MVSAGPDRTERVNEGRVMQNSWFVVLTIVGIAVTILAFGVLVGAKQLRSIEEIELDDYDQVEYMKAYQKQQEEKRNRRETH